MSSVIGLRLCAVSADVTLEFASARAKEVRALAKQGIDFFAQAANQQEQT